MGNTARTSQPLFRFAASGSYVTLSNEEGTAFVRRAEFHGEHPAVGRALRERQRFFADLGRAQAYLCGGVA